MSNPLLRPFDTPYQLPPFERIKEEHYKEAISSLIGDARKEVGEIIQNVATPTFDNTIAALEKVGSQLNRSTSVLFNLNSAETNDAIQQIAQDVSPELTAFSNELNQNPALFDRVKDVFEGDQPTLNTEEQQLLRKTYIGFIRKGAGLEGEGKERFKEITIELSKLTLTYQEHLLAATNAYELVIEKEADLTGLPEDVKSRAFAEAKERGKEGKWVFTLQAPSYIPFMEYAENRGLREKLYKAYMSRSMEGDVSNKDIVLKIVNLRAELAALLGYDSYAHYILEERMAESPERVMEFLNQLLDKSFEKAKGEVDEIKQFMHELEVDHELQRWDWAYYSEKLRKHKYEFDDELVKPYFKLENVIDGIFKTAEKLFQIKFVENNTLPVYHKDVLAYEVINHNGEVISTFYADFFPRKGKRGGAWMTTFRGQGKEGGERTVPQVSIVCNFTPSSENQPSLLKFDEVKTLFHEFGHALHGMLADTTFESLSGTNVYWDFVELPSQIMENWCYESECLELFAQHYQTGEVLPDDLIQKIKDAATYHEAYATVRQLSFGLLDMKWHNLTVAEAQKIEDVVAFEQRAFDSTELFPRVDGTNMSVQFGHIFAGGYAAGYYSYKWAEVLDADAFSLFQQNGVFDTDTSKSFKDNILSRGGTENPMELYKRFRGKEPSSEALLKRAGLI